MNRARIALLVVFSLLVAGCGGGSMQDLRTYVDEVLARESNQVEELPEFERYETYTYQSSGTTDPFEPFFEETLAATDETLQPCDVRDECNRNREELEQFPLDSLRMVGTLEQEQTMWGIVEDPEGVIHRVQVGNYVGQHHGKVMHIGENRIELTEIVPNGQGGWMENQAALALADSEG